MFKSTKDYPTMCVALTYRTLPPAFYGWVDRVSKNYRFNLLDGNDEKLDYLQLDYNRNR